jgi:two-component sensor histidine kinase
MGENKKEKEQAFRSGEITHRVQNFLNLLNSTVRLKSADHPSPEVRDFAGEISGFIDAFSRLHLLLLDTGDHGPVSTKVFSPELLDTLTGFPLVREKNIRVESRIEHTDLPRSSILPLALITIESFTNTLKYAFPEEDPAHRVFRISFSHNHSSADLSLRDNGIGLNRAASSAPQNAGSGKGFRIMEALAGQIGGEMEITGDQGTHIWIRLPL